MDYFHLKRNGQVFATTAPLAERSLLERMETGNVDYWELLTMDGDTVIQTNIPTLQEANETHNSFQELLIEISPISPPEIQGLIEASLMIGRRVYEQHKQRIIAAHKGSQEGLQLKLKNLYCQIMTAALKSILKLSGEAPNDDDPLIADFVRQLQDIPEEVFSTDVLAPGV